MLACWETVCSWSIAAGRYTSAETVRTFFFFSSLSHLPSLPAVVVLPAPWRPANRMIAGGWVARLISRTFSGSSPPITFVNSSWTMPTNAWPGVKLVWTSVPRAFSLILAMRSLTTGMATSASRRAIRISRSMSCMLDSVRRACPRMVLTTLVRRWVRESSITLIQRKELSHTIRSTI